DIVIEAAYWNPSSIRKTARALGISTDASQRFERGADPLALRYALDRAAAMILEMAGGSLLKGLIDVYPKKFRERTIPLRVSRVNSLLGTNLKKAEVVRLLGLIGIVESAGGKADTVRFRVPTFRVDVEREIDLVEEVARVYGYDRIETGSSATVSYRQPFPASSVQQEIQDAMVGRGYQEAISNPMVQPQKAALAGGTPVRILNPQNQDMAALRTSLVPGLLEAAARNHNAGNFDLRLFEVGHVFCVDNGQARKLVENFLEQERLCLVLTGSSPPVHWSGGRREVDLFDIKGDIEFLLAKFALDKSRFISYSTSNGLTDNTLAIEIQGSYAGYLGSVTREVLGQFGLERNVFVAEIGTEHIRRDARKVFVPLPRFPRVRRDVAFTVDAGIPAERLAATIRESSTELLQSVELFDVYEGEQLPGGKKSVAFTLEFMSLERTLTDAEIETAVGRVVAGVENAHGAALRSMR
ncbi:MAG TPA: phenylalanine--tRNA ligase subunit beta, partial [Bacteroidota bacterium]|nr:phenylalanine--tRNA ligase subunit beta [Bacteroidota bacterium]